ncbi:MAG: hypothetical protein ACNA8W_26045, partial [Bradymonadaceae bacterium]
INDDSTEDKFWSVEMKIPFKELPGVDKAPEQDATWRVNMYRFDRPKDSRTQAYAWASEPRTDFHRIDQFGHLTFGGPLRPMMRPKINPEALEQLKNRVNLKVESDQPTPQAGVPEAPGE